MTDSEEVEPPPDAWMFQLELVRESGRLVLWHRTTSPAAAAILAGGFRDNAGFIVAGVGEEFTGIFVSNIPLDSNEGAKGSTLLRVLLARTEEDISEFELVEDGKTYREWIVPAAILNTHGRAELFDEYAET
jgi:hypothetical protein